MIVLTDTDTLNVVLNDSGNLMECVTSWQDIDATTITPGRSKTYTDGSTPMALAASPSSGYQRIVDYISIFNAEAASRIVTIYLDNVTSYTLWRGLLEVGQSVVYQDKQGWTMVNSSGNVIKSSALPSTDVQIFTTEGSGTWTKPTWFTPRFVQVVLVGGGGGGGGGASLSVTYIRGGAGGGGGAYVSRIYSADDLGATEPLSVAASVAGGAGGVVGGGNGSDGTAGNNSTFLADGPNQLIAYGGGGGRGGIASATNTAASYVGGGGGGGAGGPGSTGTALGGAGGLPGTGTTKSWGGQGSIGTTSSQSSTLAEYGGAGGGGIELSNSYGYGGSSLYGGCGGGAGGCKYSTSLFNTARTGGKPNSQSTTGTSAVTSATIGFTPGRNGITGSLVFSGGGGDGGSGAVTADTSGANGGDGGAPGGGGGGGGNGITSGANTGGNGGAGARGEVRIYTW